MSSFENKSKVNLIEFNKTVFPFCPLGKDIYKAYLTCKIFPSKTLADFMDIDSYLNSLNGKELIIEDLTNEICKYLKDIYKTSKVEVTVEAESNKHFPVKVTKII